MTAKANLRAYELSVWEILRAKKNNIALYYNYVILSIIFYILICSIEYMILIMF